MKHTNAKPKNSTFSLMRRFAPYLFRYKGVMALDLFCAALTTACELTLPLIMRTLTNSALSSAAAFTVNMVVRMGLMYMALRIIDCIAAYYMANMGHVMGARIETDMRRDAFSHLQKLSDTYYANTKVGQIMGRITNDLFDVTEFAHHCPEEFFIAILKGIISFVISANINVPFTLIIFAFIPIMIVSCGAFNAKVKQAFRKQRRHIGELNSRIEDSLLGERVVKAFGNEDVERAKFETDNTKFLDIKKESYKYMSLFNTTVRLFDGIMYIIVIVLGGIFLTKGLIGAGDLVAYLLYVTTLLTTIRRIIEFMEQFQRGITGIERFYEIIDAEIDILDEDGAQPLVDIKGEIVFNNVSFEYPDDHNKVLHNLNLTIHSGEKLALVGPSGGGKTTLTNLIPRFYDATGGQILLDGRDVRSVTLESLRSAIGIVQQDVYLFSGTVYDNIAYGRQDATKDEVIYAATLAGADGFIMELQDGYNSYVGERGVKLSGGQKQRISIARVFLKNPPILILDEATSALDNESEQQVSNSLAKLAEGRTTLTIAHRLTTVKHADRILVLGDTGILEEGTHEELLEKQGAYYKLWTGASRSDDGTF